MERMLKTMMMVGLSLGLFACGEGDSANEEPEPPPPLACGALICDSGEYCRETSGGAAPTFSHECPPLPEGCESCECLPEPGACEETPAGLRVSVALP